MNWLQSLFAAFAPPAKAPSPAPLTVPGRAQVTAAGVNAFVGFAAPFLRVLEGKGTLADDEAAANAVMDALAFIDPTAKPIVALIEDAEPAFAAIVALVKANPGGAFTPAPRGGPPITAADWSHGIPQPQPVDNPSGAIGGV